MLKAFLAQWFSKTRLKNCFGHNLEKLVEEAERRGLICDIPDTLAMLALLSEAHSLAAVPFLQERVRN